jgi:hypothetical protein
MHDKIEQLHELCESVMREVEKTNEKLRMAGGELSAGDMEYLDKLTHTLKSLKTTIAMMEAEDDGYSSDYGYTYAQGGNRGRGRNNRSMRGSYARQRRDSMGRYSRDEDFKGMLEDAMEEAPNESIRQQLRNMLQMM